MLTFSIVTPNHRPTISSLPLVTVIIITPKKFPILINSSIYNILNSSQLSFVLFDGRKQIDMKPKNRNIKIPTITIIANPAGP